jgi:hypothetical protein
MTLTNLRNLLIGFTSDSGERLQVNGTAKITGASSFATASATDFVGIGTTTPSAKLEISRNSVLFEALRLTAITNAGVDRGTFMTFYVPSGTNSTRHGATITAANDSTASNTYLSFSTQGTSGILERMRLDASGNLGVGLTPLQKLHVNGNLLLGGSAVSIGSMNLIITGTSPVASRMTFGTDGTGYSFAIAKNQGGTITDLVTISDTGAATFSSSITATAMTLTAAGGQLKLKDGANEGFVGVSGTSMYFTDFATAAKGLIVNISTGAATFSSSVTAASAIITGNLTVDSSTFFVDATANEVGIGTNVPNSSLHVVGSITKSIIAKTANYTATVSDYTILCDTTGGGFTITLPASSGITGRIYVIKKTTASSGLNNITIDGNGSETIDGSATISLSCRSSVTLQCDGSNWHILSLYSDTLCL